MRRVAGHADPDDLTLGSFRVKRNPLTRRLLASAASLTIGAVGTLALTTGPATAQAAGLPYGETLNERGVTVTGAAECDPEDSLWLITWTVTNISQELATIVDPDPAVAGFAHNDAFQPGESKNGTQTLPSGTASATFSATLRWADEVGNEEFLTNSATVELGDCPGKPTEPEPDPVAEPAIISFLTCDLLGFIIDNREGDGEATVTFTPDRTVTHGHATGFSYTVDGENNVEITMAEGAGIAQELGDADQQNPVVLGPFPAGAEPHTHAFRATEGLTITVTLAVNGQPVDLKDNVVTWTAEGLDCPAEEDDGAGGELPVTGTATSLIAGGAVALLVLGGGLYLLARRRRITFTAG
jgi:LPXTG-motif cell wall-anchored protein